MGIGANAPGIINQPGPGVCPPSAKVTASFNYNENGKNGEAVLTINLKEAVSVPGYNKDPDVYLNYLRRIISL